MKTKPSLRLTLTTILMSLLLLTMGTFGYSFYRNARFTAGEMAAQIIGRNAALIDFQVNEMLHVAVEQGRMNLRLVESRSFRVDDFPPLARYWLDVMAVHPRLCRLSLALEATGEWFYVDRTGGELSVGELRRDARGETLTLTEYRPGEYPGTPRDFHADRTGNDARRRPWYVAARSARRQVWSETYQLLNARGAEEVPGITCASPILAADGSLVGVLGATFDVVELSAYLRDLEVSTSGFAFVVECRRDGSRPVIAHGDSGSLLRASGRAGSDGRHALELVPADEMADRRVASFLGQVPSGIKPSPMEGTTRVEFDHGGVHYLGAYSCLSSAATPDWLICIVIPENDVLGRIYRSNRATFLAGLGILAVAMLISFYVSTQVARPLERIARETEAIGRIELRPQPVAHSIVREVDRLAVAVEHTKTSLRSFGKYVPADLIRQMIATGHEATLGGERRRMTVSFCDLADFTTLSEQLSPEDLAVHLGDYFGPLSADIQATGGTVDKYIGDAIMAFWGAPSRSDGHAAAACDAALRGQGSLEGLRRRWRLQGQPELFARVGIHTGEMIVGNIGSEARFNYTVMGDPVNTASRLEGLCKVYGTRILIGESTYREAGPDVVARIVDRVSVKGKKLGILVYELLAMRADARPDQVELADRAEAAFGLYADRRWASALAAFEEIDQVRAGDGPARILAARCRDLIGGPPAEEWDGVHRMVSK